MRPRIHLVNGNVFDITHAVAPHCQRIPTSSERMYAAKCNSRPKAQSAHVCGKTLRKVRIAQLTATYIDMREHKCTSSEPPAHTYHMYTYVHTVYTISIAHPHRIRCRCFRKWFSFLLCVLRSFLDGGAWAANHSTEISLLLECVHKVMLFHRKLRLIGSFVCWFFNIRERRMGLMYV